MLRSKAIPGSIDVNIMTKLDRDQFEKGEKIVTNFMPMP